LPLGADERRLLLGKLELFHVAGEQLLKLRRLRERVGANLLEIRVVLIVLVKPLLVETLERLG